MGIFFCEMEVNCPKQWDELTPTNNPLVRGCAYCGKPVHFIYDQTEFDTAAQKGHCVAFVNQKTEGSSRTVDLQIHKIQMHNNRLKPVRAVRMSLGLPRMPDNSKLRPFIDPMFDSEK